MKALVAGCSAIALAVSGCSSAPTAPRRPDDPIPARSIFPPTARPSMVMRVQTKEGRPFECTMAYPYYPRSLITKDIEGTVRARALVEHGRPVSVEIVSGPERLHQIVRDAMMSIACSAGYPERFMATQEFDFRIQDGP